MKKILILLGILLMIGAASAYEITIDAPSTLQRGKPLVVNGTSTLPAGTTVDLQLSMSEYTVTVIETLPVVIQGDKNFSVVFGTSALTRGQYKVEVLQTQGYAYLGGSVTQRVIQIIDRSNELEITSELTQYSDSTLTIAGRVNGAGNRGVEIGVTGPSGNVFGPAFISTTGTGTFSKQVPVKQEGKYDVSISDSKGYIGNVTFTVLKVSGPVTVIPTTTRPGTPTPSRSSVSASGVASREAPAYFTIYPKAGTVRFFTSTSPDIDWAVEYLDEKGARIKVDQKSRSSPEEAVVQGTGAAIFVMVYPNTYSDRGTVTLYAENADRVEVTGSPPAALAAATTAPKTTTKSSPLSFVPFLGALGILVLLAMRRT
ncbi:MAG: hypothetical protein LUQ25_01350 [Methanoregulaceae archaeon]|nr:hypothetical protein [Methanoregulaceae archaeon]